jgi:hypothetical protein
MRRFAQTGLWEALMTVSTGTMPGCTAVSDAVLDDFIAELHNYCREEGNLAERTRTLSIAVSDLTAIKRCPPYESGEKRGYPISYRQGHNLPRM